MQPKDYPFIDPVVTRWHDNDIYGHVNNVTYYSFFDSAVNRFLIDHGGLDIHQGESVAYVVSSQCQYHKPVTYPQSLEVGVSVLKLGNSSVTYGLAVFISGQSEPVANGQFVHVFVNRKTGNATPIPEKVRQALMTLQVPGQ